MNISYFDENYNLDEIDFKHNLLNLYKDIKNLDQMNNLLFHGVQSSGKSTKIYAFLCSLFDKKVYNLKNMTFEEDRKTINYKASIYHIEINPLILGSNEKLFINSFLKDYIQTRNIGLDIPKIVVIKNAEHLTKQSQMSFRKFIERNYCTKFIFEVTNLSKFIPPLISRCLLFRIPMPKIDEIKLSIKNLSQKKNIEISDEMINDIISESNRISLNINLKKIYGYYTYYIFTNKKFVFLYYDKFIDISNYITSKKMSFVILQKIRDLVNEIYINLIPVNELIIYLFNNIYKLYEKNEKFIYKLIDLTINVDSLLKKGNKECLHVEYYIIALIDLIHNN